ncbi:MAG: GGDEF domain-containing protein, partial [Aquincola sp.]|nr:GGDEF domain-containing protein [Aquincola sp.]
AKRWQGGEIDDALLRQVHDSCKEVGRVFTQRHLLVNEMTRLVRAMTEGLTELAEDESWARGQADAMRLRLGDGGGALSLRGVRSAAELLSQTRRQQQRLRGERDRARDALRALVDSLSEELKSLGTHTGRFSEQLSQCVDGIESADTREKLSSLVHDIVSASRTVQTEVADAGSRLAAGREQAEALNERVRELESELRRLSDEASTDALTQIANRRGLAQAFEVEAARHERDGNPLAVALIDIDNFKKLNDSLGHAAGDEALKALAAQVQKTLRPVDHVARFGGEEFVMLLPATQVEEAREALGRVQRALSMSLFLHEGREVFVTFSGGVTLWRPGEDLDSAVERADLALYEAKRTGKNRTCVA